MAGVGIEKEAHGPQSKSVVRQAHHHTTKTLDPLKLNRNQIKLPDLVTGDAQSPLRAQNDSVVLKNKKMSIEE